MVMSTILYVRRLSRKDMKKGKSIDPNVIPPRHVCCSELAVGGKDFAAPLHNRRQNPSQCDWARLV